MRYVWLAISCMYCSSMNPVPLAIACCQANRHHLDGVGAAADCASLQPHLVAGVTEGLCTWTYCYFLTLHPRRANVPNVAVRLHLKYYTHLGWLRLAAPA